MSHRKPQRHLNIWQQFVDRVNWPLVIKITAAVLAVIVLVQLFFPANRVLPRVTVGSTGYALQSIDQLTDAIQGQFEKSSVDVVAGDQSSTMKLSTLGASVDANKLAEQLNQYDMWQRLIPLSIFFAGSSLTELRPTFDDTTLTEASNKLAEKMTVEAKNGSITINDQHEIVIEAAQDAVTVEASAIKTAIHQANVKVGAVATVNVSAKSSKPAVSNETIESVKATLLAMSQVNITITNSLTKKTTTPSDTDILAWLNVEDSSKVTFDDGTIRNYLIKAAGDSIITSGTTKVTMVDGQETSRIEGKSGRTVDSEPVIKNIKAALEGKIATSVALNFKTAAPTVVYDRQFSHSQAGLQAYIDSVTGSGTIQISVRQLTGNGWSASSRANESVVSASTYKLFISLLLMKKIDAGEINWSDSIQGTDVTECLRKTIVVSANNCSEDWLKQWGRSNVNSSLRSLGFSSATTFTSADAAHTSAADLQKLLIGLYNRSLFSSDNANRLIGLMKQQVYRQGIPKGSAGTVADKVGFLWGYLNDAAIVYHPRGTYVLVIMTNHQSWAKIAEITRTIESLMY